MKSIILFISLFITTISFAQTKTCDIDYTIKNDSTDFKKTNDYLFVERNYASFLESAYLSLIKSDSLSYIQLQFLQKDTNFIQTNCVDTKSIISFQLLDGSIVTLRHANIDFCNSLSYDSENNANIRILNTYFQIQKSDFENLKKSPISIMRIRFATAVYTYEIEDKITSKSFDKSFFPNRYFIENLSCIE